MITTKTEPIQWISMQKGNFVLTTPCISPFSEARLSAHRSDIARKCPMCSKIAVVNLAPHLLVKQFDCTTYICHPVLGGCNHGFAL